MCARSVRSVSAIMEVPVASAKTSVIAVMKVFMAGSDGRGMGFRTTAPYAALQKSSVKQFTVLEI
jgi:hypothetical protein